jgi:hypothetical protein
MTETEARILLRDWPSVGGLEAWIAAVEGGAGRLDRHRLRRRPDCRHRWPWPALGMPMSARMRLTERAAARRLRRSRLQEQPGLGMPKDVVFETMAYLRRRGVRISAIAEVFRTTAPAVRKVLAQHRLAAVHLVETAD